MSKKTFERMIRMNQKLNNIKYSSSNVKIKTTEEVMNTKTKKSVVNMAFAKGRESVEPTEIKRYIGVASCNIVAVNPTKAELEKIYNRQIEKEPSYISETEVNGIKTTQARIDILFKLADKYVDENGKHIDTIFRKSVFITNTPQANRDNSKFKVVDEYGNTAWVTEAQLANHDIPMYSNGPASISKNYRTLYRNEEIVMNILKTFLRVIPVRINEAQQPMMFNNQSKQWEVTNDASDGLCRFDDVTKFFKGDFKELRESFSFRPTNKIKILLGVKTVDGKTYQDVYDTVLNNNQTDYTKLEKEVNTVKDNNGYPNTEFAVCEFREYNVDSTNFANQPSVKNPFESGDSIFD